MAEVLKCPNCSTVVLDLGKLKVEKEKEIENVRKKLEADFERRLNQEFELREKENQQAFTAKLAQEKQKLSETIRLTAQKEAGDELSLLKLEIEEKDSRLNQVRKNELELAKREKALAESKADIQVAIEQGINTRLKKERLKLAQSAREKAELEHQLKIQEHIVANDSLKQQLEIMRLKIEQGSQKRQGQAQEIFLQEELSKRFPQDDFEAVSSGKRGADLLQRVKDETGKVSGLIFWESKRTQNWSDKWVSKLKTDQQRVGADIGVIVSTSMPKDTKNIALRRGVWVCSLATAPEIALLLRTQLIELYRIQNQTKLGDQKKELIYNYLISKNFQRHVENLIESLLTQKGNLDKERISIEKSFARREQGLQKALMSIAGLYGDLQGLASNSLPEIKMLSEVQ